MSTESLVIKLKGTVNDDSLPKLNSFKFGINYVSNTISTMRIVVKAGITEQLPVLTFLDNCCTVYGDAAGSVNLGNSITLSEGSNLINVAATAGGNATIDNFHNIIGLGGQGQWSPTNTFTGSASAFQAIVTLDDLVWNKDLTSLNLKTDIVYASSLNILDGLSLGTFHQGAVNYDLPGDSSFMRNMPNLYNLSINSKLFALDLNDLVYAGGSNMSLEIVNVASLKYSGTTAKKWTGIAWLRLQGGGTGNTIPTAQLDNLLISLAESTWNTTVAAFRGVRSSASDAAVATLQAKGVTLTFS